MKKEVVCVTGASGFIASWLVKLLLHRGYTVHATVRNLGDPMKVEHLKAFEGAVERLKLFEADLMKEGSFDAAIDGCDGVFHTASPVIFNDVEDPQKELIEPAVNGTLNVLRSCLKAPSIKRVVLTSSTAAVTVSKKAINGGVTIDEDWYSDPIFCQENKMWYVVSKTLAEEEAWKFAKQHGIDLVVMNPGLVIGCWLQPILNITSDEFLVLIKEGKSPISLFGAIPLVDVKDVALAHVVAFENPLANGRYCLVATSLNASQIFDMLRDLFPTLTLPKIDEDDTSMAVQRYISKEKVESLGINFTPIRETLKETVEHLVETKLLVIS